MSGIINALVGLGGGSGPLYVEDVFSTYLYSGNGSTQTITNGIDLAGKGGLVWIKSRSAGGTSAYDHFLTYGDFTKFLRSNTTQTAFSASTFTSSSSGFNLLNGYTQFNENAVTYASWTFREAPNFFDVVTYTGDGVNNRQIAHNLGVTPGMVIVKRTNTTGVWEVYHRSLGQAFSLRLNTTDAQNGTGNWGSTPFTDTTFTVGAFSETNGSGSTYVAYLYAHDTASDGIIQCGSFTTDGSGNVGTVTLGWEPQWVLFKRADGTGSWITLDNMRGFNQTQQNALYPNMSDAEYAVSGNFCFPTATGFSGTGNFFGTNANMVYMAIRRGPMKTPTLGTSVFVPWTRTGTGTTAVVSSTTFPPDLLIERPYASSDQAAWFDRLRGRALSLVSNGTTTETVTTTTTNDLVSFNMNGITVGANMEQAVNTNGASIIDYNFRRAPGFFDEVCYTGNGSTQAVAHNLSVAPELIIVKSRSAAASWTVYSSGIAAGNYLFLNLTNASAGPNTTIWGNNSAAVAPTSTAFTVGSYVGLNQSSGTYVAYLFASCPGVSKVGSYTGNGSSQTINCAFTTGARFVLIKRTDSTGDWLVWDSARGIVAGNDPYLALNTAAAQVTSDDSVDTDNTGFIVNQVAASNVNVNAATYIFLAIA